MVDDVVEARADLENLAHLAQLRVGVWLDGGNLVVTEASTVLAYCLSWAEVSAAFGCWISMTC